jgi:hypothetical protein
MFRPALHAGRNGVESTAKIGAEATEGVTASYTVVLANGQRQTAHITFF